MFDNEDHNGQMAVTLDSDEQVLTCNGVVNYASKIDIVFRSTPLHNM